MTNAKWPIYASPDQAESAQIENGVINRSVVGSGSIVDGAALDHAMLRRSVLVERGARLEHCIVMERSRIGRGAAGAPRHHRPGQRRARRRAHRLRPRARPQALPRHESGIVVVPAGYFPPRKHHGHPPFRAPIGRRAHRRGPAMEVVA
jgi:glucose-1-phosphate adenylyltransferase